MKYLIDTHVFLWITENSPKLPDRIKKIVLNDDVPIYISIASFWEIAIKLGKGTLKIDSDLSELKRLSDENNFTVLPVSFECLQLLLNMPFHHKDPFDRLLVATAIIEDMTLITRDENIHKYDLPVLW